MINANLSRIAIATLVLLSLSCKKNSNSFTKDYSSTNQTEVCVKMLPSVELVSMLSRYAGYQEYCNNGIYASDKLNTHFSKYKNHKAVEYANILGVIPQWDIILQWILLFI